MSDHAACPHCGVVLDPPPKGNRKCPECREPIVVRTRKGTRVLLTPAGVESYDRERQREIASNKARRHAANIGVDDAEWARSENQLTERFGHPPSGGDVFWSLANQAVHEAIGKSDWGRLHQLYFSMALHLKDEGRDYADLRREAMRASVREHIAQAAGFSTEQDPPLTSLGCRSDCQSCAADAGKTFRASELLPDDAPLPHDCEWCACGVVFDERWMEQQHQRAMTNLAEETSAARPRGGLLRRLFGG